MSTRHSPLATRHSPLATRHSPLATRHSPLFRATLSSLLQILVRTIGLAHQEWNVLVGRVDEALDDLHRLLEFLDEFVVLAVAPGLAQAGDLTVEHGQLVHEIVVELLQPRGESADFLRIHDGLCHAMPLSETSTGP